nr:MAG: DUF58 domain-containing protein [Pseudomonadota bacterium]
MLTREIVAQVRRLEIQTRKAVAETFAGSYQSVFKGTGMVFQEVRPYQPGDDVRAIDWNVSARMQQPYVKVFTEERERTAMLLLDLSRSLDFGTVDRTKGRLAAELAALLVFSAVRSGDRVGAILFSDRIESFVPPKKGKKHGMALVARILTAQPEGRGTDIAGALHHLGRVIRRRAIVFLLSDFLGSDFEPALKVAARRHELVPIVLRDPAEEELPALGLATVEDPETGARMEIDLASERMRRRYQALIAAQVEARRRLFRRLDIEAVEVRCGEDPVRPLAAYFAAVRRRRAG